MAGDLATSLRDLLVDFLRPLEEAARDTNVLVDWLGSLGYTEAVSGHPALLQIVQRAPALVTKLKGFTADSLETTDGLLSLLSTADDVSGIVQALRDFGNDPARSQFAERLGEDVMSLLLASYLRRNHPTGFRIASLLTIVEPRETIAMEPAVLDNGGTVLRYARVMDRFNFATISALVQQPGATLEAIYFPNGLAQGADAWLCAQRLFPALSYLANAVDLSWHTDYRLNVPPLPPSDLDPDNPIHDIEEDLGQDPEDPVIAEIDDSEQVAVALAPLPPPPDAYFGANDPVFILDLAGDATSTGIGLEILAASKARPPGIAGLILGLVGSFNDTETRGQWKTTLSASGGIPALVVGPDGLSRAPQDTSLTKGTAKILLERLPDAGSSGPAFVLGSQKGTRLEIGTLSLAGDLSFDPQKWAADIALTAKSGALVLASSDGDSFLSSILPADGVRADFDLGLAWSNTGGVTLHGSAGLEATLPIGRSLGPLTLSSVTLGLRVEDASVVAEVAVTMSVGIGPLQASVDRIGLNTALTFPQGGGNIGPADLDFRFKPPTGLGIAIDTASVTGGGYLSFDPQKGEYAGVLQLEIADRINVKAIGLLTTKLPDGSRGYSLIVFITAEGFQPIQLGMGFALIGLGGMIAINRTFDEDAMREGLKNNSLASILFPADPIRNAPAILRSMATVFPIRPGSYLFGPMARICWLSGSLITMDLALILEFGTRKRLIALGRISSLLPSADNDLIRLNMDAAGVLDFDQGTVSIDAVLVDSRLLHKYALTGSMALRACLVPGPQAGFALAVGGWNPHFTPPANMPQLERITINLSSGDNPRFVCNAYWAITSNTIQFGSNASLYAAAYGFSVSGDVGYDVLVQLLPFHFLAEFHASIQLKHGSSNLFKVKVEGALEGPRPLRVSAKATFEILWCDFSIHFDKTLVDGDKPPLPPGVDVFGALVAALTAAESWSTDLPASRTHGVAVRKLPVNAPLSLDPLGELRVKQTVVPLNTNRDLDVFGGAPLVGARRFTVTAAQLNGAPQTVQTTQDMFAPAQFFSLSDDDELASPSFEQMVSGVTFGGNAIAIDDSPAQRAAAPVEYDSIIIDTEAPLPVPGNKYVLLSHRLLLQARFGAVAQASVRTTGLARFQNAAAAPAVTLNTPHWVVASTASLATVAPTAGTSWGDAHAALQTLRQATPAGASPQWQLARAFEVTP
jgi:hypothetical protein